jgi:hypothetical protein
MVDELLGACNAAWRRGVDFPTIWRDILRIDPLAGGPAIQMADGARTWLEIPLSTGQRLVFRRADGFSLLSRVAIVLRERSQV